MNETVAQHTPGPWRVHVDEHRGGPFIMAVPAPGLNEYSVARTYDIPYKGAREANARLIAAAPELLAAARAVWERYEQAAEKRWAFDPGLEQLGIAIAKAEGRES